MNKSQMLKTLARRQGLCDAWYSDWSEECSDEELLEKAENGMHFLCKHDYPGIDAIRSMFNKEQLKEHSIYLDQNVFLGSANNGSIRNKDVLLVGNTTGKLVFNGYSVSNVYVMHNCDITIECHNLSKVFVSASGNAKLNIIANDASVVYVYNYGNVICKTKGDVKIRDRKGVKIETIQ